MTFSDELFGKVIIPLSYYLTGDLRFKYFEDYKKNLFKSKNEINAFQLARLKELVLHAYKTVPYYKELFDSINIKPEDIKSIGDLKKIPALDKKTLMHNLDKLKSTKKFKLIKAFSGGSTGNKAIVYKDYRYYYISSGVWLRDLYSVGIKPGQKSVWVWGDSYIGKSFRQQFFNRLSLKINRRLLFNAFKYTDKELKCWLENKFNRFKPDYIYGYAGTIYDIAKFIKENNIKITPIKMIVTTAERLENRAFIESVFKCLVIDQYGCGEITSIGIENKNQVMHSSDDFVIVEVNSNHEIILTPFESYGMPLLRYKLGDIGLIRKNEKNISSFPFNTFNITIGRTYEMLLNKKNERVSGGLIKIRIENENLDIHEFQIVQKSLDKVVLNIVRDEHVSKRSVARLKEIITEILGASTILVNYVNSFPIEPNGKRIAFKCEVKKR